MQRYEYKVIPAPIKGEKTRGAKTTPDRFAYKLTTIMNDMARDGWEYQRADTLPCEERSGLTGKVTTYQNMLVFRRPVALSRALPIFDETTVPADLLTGASPSGQLRPTVAPLAAHAPEGKTPRITAFARVTDPSQDSSADDKPAGAADGTNAPKPVRAE